MNSSVTSTQKARIFYGWFVIAGLVLIIIPVGGAINGSFGVLLPVITSEFGWSRAEVSIAVTLSTLAFGLPSPLWGILTSRFGSRRVIIIGNAIAALGMAGIFLVHEVWHVYLFYLLAGLGAGIGGFIAATAMLNNWFVRRRSLALGIMQSCSGLGGFIYPPVTTALVEGIGWRPAWLILSGIIMISSVAIGGGLLIRNRPEDKGSTPDGMPPDAYLEYKMAQASLIDHGDPSSWGILQVLKKPTVWLIGGFMAANAFIFGMLYAHQIAYIQDIGFSPMTAATTMSVLSGFSVIGSLVFGFLALKFNPRYLTIIAFIIQILAMIILLTTKELVFIYLFAILLGYSNGSLLTAFPTIVGAYYPPQRYSRVLGVVFPFHVIAHALSAAITGAVYDATSSYTTVFIAATLLGVAGLFFSSQARQPKE